MNYEELMWAWIRTCYSEFGTVLRINLVEHDENGTPVIGHVADGVVETKTGERVSTYKLGYHSSETLH